MSTKSIKSKIKKGADKSESRMASVAASLSNGAGTLNRRGGAMKDRLSYIGRHLLGSTRDLTDEVSAQARLRPWAVFGIAFAAGVIITRALRR